MTATGIGDPVVWHDVECSGYGEDLGLWRELAGRAEGVTLDVGAGTGRVTIDLARQGHAVIALDHDQRLLAELGRRAAGITPPVRTVLADARSFSLEHPVALVIAPMQTVQLLGGAEGRAGFLASAGAVLAPGGRIAVALAERLEPFEVTGPHAGPLPDIREVAGTVYSSRPIAVRPIPEGWQLDRLREIASVEGEHASELDRLVLDRVTARGLEAEAASAGLRALPRVRIAPTPDHVGSTVVMLGG